MLASGAMDDVGSEPARLRFSPARRLKRSRDFDRVRLEGRALRSGLLTLGVLEVEEETGHSGFRRLRKLGEYTHRFEERPEDHRRHVFHLAPPAGLPERWEHFAENAHWFAFEWVPLAAVPDLAASQGDLLHALASPPPGDEGSERTGPRCGAEMGALERRPIG